MEWSEFLESSFCPNLEALQMVCTGWDYEENKTFENALGELGFGCPDLLQKVEARIPGKSFEEVVSHFASLVQDIEIIESAEVLGTDHDQKQGSSATTPISTSRRGVPWTVQEHKLFLVGLIAYGKGDWRSISRHCVKTRSPTQVASHAQKYFKRHSMSSALSSSSSSSSRRRRRCSIHDTEISFDDTSISSLLPDIFHMLHPSSSSNITGKDNPNSPTPSTIGCKEFEEN